MQLYIDQGTNSFITDPLFKSPLPELSFKRGDSATVNLAFVSGNTSLSAVSGKSLKFGVKQAGDYDGAYLVYTDTYTTAGTNYVLKPSFNTTNLNALLSGDIASVAGMLEVTWSDNGIDEFSSNTQAITINNDVNKLGEAPPYVLPVPLEWLGNNQIALSSTPYVAQVTLLPTFGIPPVPLFPTISGSIYSSNGNTTAPVSGNWFDLRYSSGNNGWLSNWWVDQIQTAQDSQWLLTGLSAFPPSGAYEGTNISTPELQYIQVATTTQNTKDTHRFLANSNTEYGNNELFVNIGALSGISQNWRKITTTAIATL